MKFATWVFVEKLFEAGFRGFGHLHHWGGDYDGVEDMAENEDLNISANRPRLRNLLKSVDWFTKKFSCRN